MDYRKRILHSQKQEYDRFANQYLPRRLIKMQRNQKSYASTNFFLFDLLGHPFMTESLLRAFKGKSLFRMCLYLHKRCKLNFDSYSSDTKLEKLFNNPNLDKIFIMDERMILEREAADECRDRECCFSSDGRSGASCDVRSKAFYILVDVLW